MKLKNILAMPVAMVADVISLGNIGGGRSFTQQVFDRDRQEHETEQLVEAIKALTKK